ncbi:MAG: leucine-rich repeat protein [Treponema sp.]
MFAIACKQASNSEKQKPTELKEITITVKGDEGVTVNKLNTIKIKKSLNLTWKDIKNLAEATLTLKGNKDIKEWRIKGVNGKLLQDGTTFEKDETVFAITKDKEPPKPPANLITITIEADAGYTFKEATPCTIEIAKNTTWARLKPQAKPKIELKKDYKEDSWKLGGKDGELIGEGKEFKENATVFAVSKRKVVGYKVEHLKENIEDSEYTVFETETKTGEAGNNTNAEAKQYEGFTSQGLAQSVIKADGLTVVQIKYKRNIVSLILDLDGGSTTTILKDGQDGNKLLTGKFESEVSIMPPTKQGFRFESWKPELPTHFPANDERVHTAKWKAKTIYRVTIKGNERVKVAEPQYIDVPIGSNKKIEDIKAKIIAKVSLKPEWSSEDYCFYDWRIGGEKGDEMLDATLITDDMVVYARTNYNKFKFSGTHIYCEEEKPRGRIFIPCGIIEYKAFQCCTDLTAVYLCDRLLGVGPAILDFAFSGCTSLESMDLSKYTGGAWIGQGAFSGCGKLEIKLPASITEIGLHAFGKNSSTYCKKVLVPNETVKQLVKDSGYPEERIEIYH